ncbi:G5 domain-containing protein [Streptococcus uberis]|uniref:G5 domain-containing protein n=2 Tax=Streptococcus uberis TaxID=1349 RepID=UPI00379E02F1
MFKKTNNKYAIRKLNNGANSVVIGAIGMMALCGGFARTVSAEQVTTNTTQTQPITVVSPTNQLSPAIALAATQPAVVVSNPDAEIVTTTTPAPNPTAPAKTEDKMVTVTEPADQVNQVVEGGTHTETSTRRGDTYSYNAQGSTTKTIVQTGVDGTTTVTYRVVYDYNGKEIARDVISVTQNPTEKPEINNYTPDIIVDEHEVFNHYLPGDTPYTGGIHKPMFVPLSVPFESGVALKLDDIVWTDGITKEFAQNMVFTFNTWDEFISKNQSVPGFELFLNFLLAQEKYRNAFTDTSHTTLPNYRWDPNTGEQITDPSDIQEIVNRSTNGNNAPDAEQVDLTNYSLKDKIALLNEKFYTAPVYYPEGTLITNPDGSPVFDEFGNPTFYPANTPMLKEDGTPLTVRDRLVQSFQYYLNIREYWKAHEDIKRDVIVRFNPNLKSSEKVLVQQGQDGRIEYAHFDYYAKYIDGPAQYYFGPGPMVAMSIEPATSTPISTSTTDINGITYVTDPMTGEKYIDANSYYLLSEINKNVAQKNFSYSSMQVGDIYKKTLPIYVGTQVNNPNYDPSQPESSTNLRFIIEYSIQEMPLDVIITQFVQATPDIYEYGVDAFTSIATVLPRTDLALTDTETLEVPFNTEVRYNPNLKPGESRIVQVGSNGTTEVTVTYDSATDTYPTDIIETVISTPVSEIIEVGTGVTGQAVEHSLEVIDYAIEIVYDSNLTSGTVQIDQKGVNGYKDVLTTTETLNGQVIGTAKTTTNQKDPLNTIIRIGTKIEPTPEKNVVVTHEESVQPQIIEYRYNDQLTAGTSNIIQKGQDGFTVKIISQPTVNGIPQGDPTVQLVTQDAINTIIELGTRPIEVIKEVPVEVIKEVPVEVIVEKEVIKEVPVEVIKEVPVEVIKEITVEVIKEVPVNVPVDKIVEVVKEVIVEVTKEVPVEVIKEVPVEVIKEITVEVIKEVPINVPVEVIKEVVVEVIKEIPVEVIKEVPVEVIVEKEVPVETSITVETIKEKIAYPTEVRKNPDLSAGEIHVIQKGIFGESAVTTKTTVVTKNGQSTSTKTEDISTIIDPVAEVIEVGTKVDIPVIPPIEHETPTDPVNPTEPTVPLTPPIEPIVPSVPDSPTPAPTVANATALASYQVAPVKKEGVLPVTGSHDQTALLSLTSLSSLALGFALLQTPKKKED